jgi:tetratricopeptide (TPR) repeat protein
LLAETNWQLQSRGEHIMSRFAFLTLFCTGLFWLAGSELRAQPSFDNPFGEDKPADDKKEVLPPGLFDDDKKPVDDKKAPKDGGRDSGSAPPPDLPDAGTANYARGLRLIDEGEWKDAISYLDDAITASPRSSGAYLARARAKIGQANESFNATDRSTLYTEAIADCDKVLTLKPRSREAYFQRGIAQRMENGFKQANLSFTSAIEIDAKYADAYLRRGIVLFYLNKDAIAPSIFDFDEAIRINKNDYRAHLWRGLLYSRNGEYDPAIESFGRALEVEPDFAPALSNRGLAYLKLSQLENALADFTELTQVSKEDATAFFKRGVAESELERYDDAIASFKKAIFLDPSYADAFYNRSIAYADLDEFDKSDADYTEAVRLNPELKD